MIVIVVTGSREYANEAQIRADLETYRGLGRAVTLPVARGPKPGYFELRQDRA